MYLPDTHHNVEHVRGRWLASLERYADARKRYPDLSDSEFERLAREFRSLITVGKQADLFIDVLSFEALYQNELAKKVEAEPLPELTPLAGQAQVRLLQESIRQTRSQRHRLMGQIAWFDHGCEMHDLHTGTLDTVDNYNRREVVDRVKANDIKVAELEEELDSLVALYSVEGAAEITSEVMEKYSITKSKKRRKF